MSYLQMDRAEDARQAEMEAYQDAQDRSAELIAKQADKFKTAFMGRCLADLTGFTTHVVITPAGGVKREPSTVADMAMDAMECGELSLDDGIAVLLTAVQLCARKGDVDALKAVGVLAMAWGTEYAGVSA